MNGGVLWLLKSFQNLTRGLGEQFESCCAFCKDCAGGSIQTKRGTFDLGRATRPAARPRLHLRLPWTPVQRRWLASSLLKKVLARWGLKQKCWTMDRLNVAKYDRFFSMVFAMFLEPHVCGTISAAIFFFTRRWMSSFSAHPRDPIACVRMASPTPSLLNG